MHTGHIRHYSRSEAGFTLLELLLSITMIGLILLLTGAAVRLGMRSVASGEKRMAAIDRFSSALNIVDAQLQSQLNVAKADASDTTPAFKGESTSMQFSSIFSIWGYQKGYVNVTYRVVQDQFGKQELHAEESAIGSVPRGELKLFQYFDRIYFDYYNKKAAEQEGSWSEQWQDPSSVPEKIRLHLVAGNSEISLIIPLRVRDVQMTSAAAPPNTSAAPAPNTSAPAPPNE
ncbi:MAG: prepilin-type N-terminal cleavage/methylation domain-containing protein [Nitrospirae bacterium]|nr:prepilin-type N-terminal cleavage/methylation domain-containing protein [Nitrospirota bacterium]